MAKSKCPRTNYDDFGRFVTIVLIFFASVGVLVAGAKVGQYFSDLNLDVALLKQDLSLSMSRGTEAHANINLRLDQHFQALGHFNKRLEQLEKSCGKTK